jgi:beta-xylosidase
MSLAPRGLPVAVSLLLLAACSSSDPADPSEAGTTSPPGDASVERDAGASTDATTGTGADGSAPPATYLNPVLDQDFPDPFILRVGETYFAFATNAGTSNIQSATSSDLAHWTVLGDALPTLPGWAQANSGLTWAPSILPRGAASFVMYYTARDTASGRQCISVAVASSAAGPYVDSSKAPLVCQVSGSEALCGSIDASPFVDSDGSAHLVWKSDENACGNPPRLWTAPLSDDGKTLTGAHTALLTMNEPWQSPIIEGPAMTLVGGTYYLLYSANNYESASYAMGYATCLSVSGPCQNVSVSGPFISSAGSALGPGGGELFLDKKGDAWLAYHAWTAPLTTYAGGGARSLRIDRLDVDAGVLSLVGPTTTPQLL